MPKRNNKQKKEPVSIGKYLERDPGIHRGALIFKGTRVRVEVVLAYIAKGMSIDEATKGWPDVSREAILEALSLASKALIREYEGRKAA